MRAINVLTVAVLMAITAIASPIPAHAKADKHRTQESVTYPGLSEIRSFDVFDMELNDFSASRENIPHEAVEYARTAMETSRLLNYSSPAQGVLRFKCDNESCSRIRAEVTRGPDGPVVWKTVQQYRHCPLTNFRFMPDSKKFANTVVNMLAQDYKNSMKEVSARIQIQEE